MNPSRFISLLCFLFPILISAQAVKFYASLDAKEVVTGAYIELKFTIENGSPENFQIPKFNGLQLAGGPSQQSQISIVNGRRSEQISYVYTLIASKPGTYTIGSAQVAVKGKKYKSNPLTLKVVKAIANSNSVEYFVTVELSDSVVYQGQQLTLKYKVFGVKDVHSADFVNEPKFDGFFVNRIRNFRDRTQRVVIDGVQYIEKTLKTYALFPQQTGKFKIDPSPVTLGIPSNNSRSGFFFSTRLVRKNVVAEGTEIEVLPTPRDAPVSYAGGIGKFSIQTSVDKRSITTDDAVTMRMKITGTGDSKFILPPQQPANNDWEIYDPNLLNEETQEKGDLMLAAKDFEYLMVPKKKGRLAVRPEFSYFDPDSARYITLLGNQQVVNVVQGAGDNTLAEAKQQEALALAPIVTTTKFSKAGKYFMFSMSYWAIMTSLLLVILGILMYKNKLMAIASIDPSTIRKSEADKVAKARLQSAEQHLTSKETKLFFTDINDSLYGYVSDKMQIPSSQLTRANIKEQLLIKNVDELVTDSFVTLLDKVQRALYAGGGIDQMQPIYNEAAETISNLESFLKNAS